MGIIHEKTPPNTPQLNGVAERMNRTIWEKAECMRKDAGLPKFLWAEMVMTATYLTNRSPTSAPTQDQKKTPHELWTGKRPKLGNLRKIGSLVFTLVPRNVPKLGNKTVKGILVGYDTNGYRIWIPETTTVIRSRNTKIFENKRGIKSFSTDREKDEEAEMNLWPSEDIPNLEQDTGGVKSYDLTMFVCDLCQSFNKLLFI